MPRPRTFDEDATVRTARDVFRHSGYAGTAMSDLVDATGLGSGSLYNAFGSKQALFDRAFGDYCAEATAASDSILRQPDAGLGAALAFVRSGVRASAHDKTRVGCMIAGAASELASQRPAVVDRASRTLRHLQDSLAGAAAHAREVGELNSALEPDDAALLLLCVNRGIDALATAGYPVTALERIEDVIRMLLSRAPDSEGLGE